MRKATVSSVLPLPSDFAEQVLTLEYSVENDFSIDSLRALLELYSVI